MMGYKWLAGGTLSFPDEYASLIDQSRTSL